MTELATLAFPPDNAALPSRDGILSTLLARAEAYPVLLGATLIFALAIAHTFVASKFQKRSLRMEAEDEAAGRPVRPSAMLYHFLGEVETIFGIWALVLFGMLAAWPGLGWEVASEYINSRNYAEPIFVVVIMTMAAAKPVVDWAEIALGRIAKLGGSTPLAWWFTLLTVAPLLGSFITEPAAMTLTALLLRDKFFSRNPSPALAYGTLALLFVNISVGGTLTNFSAPPILMVAAPWQIGPWDMAMNFGWKAALGIVVATGIYAVAFRREFGRMRMLDLATADAFIGKKTEPHASFWVFALHVGFIVWTVNALLTHRTSMLIAGLLFFLPFTAATSGHNRAPSLRGPVLVGFFLAGLVIHGGLQSWWIGPILGSLGEWPLFFGATALTAVNDNAAITYLASQVPALADLSANESVGALRYAVLAGAVTGGGLTLIANAPNPAGIAILSSRFPLGVSALKLFIFALLPTATLGACFMLLP